MKPMLTLRLLLLAPFALAAVLFGIAEWARKHDRNDQPK